MSRPRARPGESAGKAPSQRQLRVGELIRHKLSELLARGDIHDDVLTSAMITIPEVRLSPDLKLATVYVMTLGTSGVGSAAEAKPVIAAFERNKRFIRGEVAEAVNLKFAPDLRFRYDETGAEAARIEALLASAKVRQDLKK